MLVTPLMAGFSAIALALTAPTASQNHWPDPNGKQTVVFVENESAGRRVLATAMRRWSKSSEIEMHFTKDCSSKPRCVTVAVKPLDQGHSGRATLAGGDHLAWAQVVMDDDVRGADKAYILCHELGHALGLVHPADGSDGPCRGVRPTARDYKALRQMYGHEDAL